jgi:hypothetical protein
MTPSLAYDMYCIVRVRYNIVHIVRLSGFGWVLIWFYRLSPSVCDANWALTPDKRVLTKNRLSDSHSPNLQVLVQYVLT